jgi:methanogenic corrinoid protein MtbC1
MHSKVIAVESSENTMKLRGDKMDEKYMKLAESIREGESDTAVNESLALLDRGTEVSKVFTECIEPVLMDIGDRFAILEIFLPELLLASDAAKAVQEKLDPIMKDSSVQGSASHRAVIATVYGDVHDIGKNIVGVMLEVNGIDVKNLGVDVSTNDIVKAAEDYDADLVCLSGLMMPSMPYMKDTIDRIKGNLEHAERFKILVGGGPVTKEWAEDNGADGYADDAIGAVREALRVLG